MNGTYLWAILASTLLAATPLIFAALGELVAERAGVLNLGIEGMMLTGAVSGFAVTLATGQPALGLLAALGAGMAMALLFGFLVLTLQANQVATGLALTLFGIGVSAFAGRDLAGRTVAPLAPIAAGLDPLVFAAPLLAGLIAWVLAHTRLGLVLRAVGEAPHSAHAIGIHVVGVRYGALLFGGALAGIAGAYLPLVLTPMWVEGMTAGRGWIALAMVVFATWKPRGVLAGAYLFGGVTVLQFHGQGLGLDIPSEFLSMLPYLATIVVLVIICRNPRTLLLNRPAALGRNFKAD